MILERFNVNMILPDIGHMGSCGTEFREHKRGWSGLGPSQLLQSFNLQVINPVITARIAAPDTLRICKKEKKRCFVPIKNVRMDLCQQIDRVMYYDHIYIYVLKQTRCNLV